MSSFAPLDSLDERTHRQQLAKGVNAALRGDSHNTGQITVPAGTEDYVINDPRIGVGRILVFTPANAEAAQLQIYLTEVLNGSAAISFINMPSDEAVFYYAIIGMGGNKGV
jgi:hypothetical protein